MHCMSVVFMGKAAGHEPIKRGHVMDQAQILQYREDSVDADYVNPPASLNDKAVKSVGADCGRTVIKSFDNINSGSGDPHSRLLKR